MTVLLLIFYLLVYWRAVRRLDQNDEAFIIDTCLVCGGELSIESRTTRFLGIPRLRRIVRCQQCRSTLREVSEGRWRYTVDRKANPRLYLQLNGKKLTDDELIQRNRNDFTVPDEGS